MVTPFEPICCASWLLHDCFDLPFDSRNSWWRQLRSQRSTLWVWEDPFPGLGTLEVREQWHDTTSNYEETAIYHGTSKLITIHTTRTLSSPCALISHDVTSIYMCICENAQILFCPMKFPAIQYHHTMYSRSHRLGVIQGMEFYPLIYGTDVCQKHSFRNAWIFDTTQGRYTWKPLLWVGGVDNK